MSGFLGIDWGTNSSKWYYQTDTQQPAIAGRIWDSTVWREDDKLLMAPAGQPYHGGRSVRRLKRTLIQDPHQAVWTGERTDIGVSTGQAIVFSLLALLADARATVRGLGRSGELGGDLTVRFSHPNWIRPESAAAMRALRDAAVTALSADGVDDNHLAADGREFSLPAALIKSWLPPPELCDFPVPYHHQEHTEAANGRLPSGIQWSLVFESCAAGFPLIAESEGGLYESGPDGVPLFRKVLVVDVGAGSTDAAYMLRTIRPVEGTPLLIWLPPAGEFEKAGQWLTDRILEKWRTEGRARATRDEAEIYKTSGATEWYQWSFVRAWCDEIAAHVAEYVKAVPDKVRLPRSPRLEVRLTGGSSAVAPLAPALEQSVKRALEQRGIAAMLAQATTCPRLGPAQDSVRAAQMAVAIGASDPRLTDLKPYEDLK